MKADEVVSAEFEASSEADDLFEMANLFLDTTGLPMTVCVSPRGNSRHDVRVKVNMTHGNQMNASLNTAVLVGYWEGEIDTSQLVHALKRLPEAQAS